MQIDAYKCATVKMHIFTDVHPYINTYIHTNICTEIYIDIHSQMYLYVYKYTYKIHMNFIIICTNYTYSL